MKHFPVICPLGSNVVITQGFQPASNPTHDAVDFVIWNNKLTDRENWRLTYASQLVCPATSAKCVLIDNFGTMNTLGNGIDIEWQEGGKYHRLHFWHTCMNQLKLGETCKEGDIVGFMGNTGDCKPLPTPEMPYNGTHCHMRYSQYDKDQFGVGNINIVSLDPRLYFDVNNPYQGDDSSVVLDLEPVKWAWLKLGITSISQKLMYFLTNIFG